MNHERVRLAALIDWTAFDDRFGELYRTEIGYPAKPTELMVGLLYLKHLRAFHSRAKRWPQTDDKFKPLPEGLVLSELRRRLPE